MAIEMIYAHALAYVVRRVGPTFAVVLVGFDEFLIFVRKLFLSKSKENDQIVEGLLGAEISV